MLEGGTILRPEGADVAGATCFLLEDECPLCTYRKGDCVGVTAAGLEDCARGVSLGESSELISMTFSWQELLLRPSLALFAQLLRQVHAPAHGSPPATRSRKGHLGGG